MSLTCRQQRHLRYIEASVRRTDPHLGAMLGMFGRLYPEKDLPAWEQESRAPTSQSRIRRVSAWIVVALTAVAAAIEVLFGRAAAVATAGRRARRMPAEIRNPHTPYARKQDTKRGKP